MNRLITILFLGITTITMQANTDKEQLTNEARAEGKLACTMPCKEKEDESQIGTLYRDMYEAMVAKDTVVLNHVHADDFVLTHMTGMHQSKQEYIRAIANGTLNYYSAVHEQTEIKVSGNHATLTGRSRVTAAVFGGGRHIWRLQLHFNLSKVEGRWYFTSARASTY
jgi:ketosteroid isomerase-like protein